MKVEEFREKIRPGSKVIVGDKELEVEEVVSFRLDDGDFYIKCFLSDGFVLADDLSSNTFVLVKKVENDIQTPFPQRLDLEGKEFEFLCEAHAIAEEIQGKEIFKKDDSETFWDYRSVDGSYLSLGINDQTGEREDYFGKIVEEVELS